MHLQNAADNPLLPLVIHYDSANASFAERYGMDSISRFALIIERNTKANQSVPNCGFGGRELTSNLPQRTLFEDIFLMKVGLVKSYWKCFNY